MIYIFFNNSAETSMNYQKYLHQLPYSFQQQILRYRNRKDAQRSLFGKLLLDKGLKLLGWEEYSLSEIKYSAHQRPYFDHNLDFNIAHSGDYVICAISKTNKVGVDIEECKTTRLLDFHDNFTREEWAQIMNSDKCLQEFYTLWTQKEAIIKASGEGLSIPLKQVLIKDRKAMIRNEKWHLVPLNFSQNYISHLATDSDSLDIKLQQLDFN